MCVSAKGSPAFIPAIPQVNLPQSRMLWKVLQGGSSGKHHSSRGMDYELGRFEMDRNAIVGNHDRSIHFFPTKDAAINNGAAYGSHVVAMLVPQQRIWSSGNWPFGSCWHSDVALPIWCEACQDGAPPDIFEAPMEPVPRSDLPWSDHKHGLTDRLAKHRFVSRERAGRARHWCQKAAEAHSAADFTSASRYLLRAARVLDDDRAESVMLLAKRACLNTYVKHVGRLEVPSRKALIEIDGAPWQAISIREQKQVEAPKGTRDVVWAERDAGLDFDEVLVLSVFQPVPRAGSESLLGVLRRMFACRRPLIVGVLRTDTLWNTSGQAFDLCAWGRV